MQFIIQFFNPQMILWKLILPCWINYCLVCSNPSTSLKDNEPTTSLNHAEATTEVNSGCISHMFWNLNICFLYLLVQSVLTIWGLWFEAYIVSDCNVEWGKLVSQDSLTKHLSSFFHAAFSTLIISPRVIYPNAFKFN